MISFDDYRVVDLSPRIKARVHRVDGTIEEGTNAVSYTHLTLPTILLV